jgi:cysteinyl-tRNA synthetase
MDDDLAVPRALGVLHETVRDGNAALAAGDKDGVRDALVGAQAMLDVLGLSPGDFVEAGGDTGLRRVLDVLVPAVLDARRAARERKDFAESDRVRDALAAAGIVVEDTPGGQRWRLG